MQVFRQLSRELETGAPPLYRLLRRLPEGPAAQWLRGGTMPQVSDQDRVLLQQARCLLGGYDAVTQASELRRLAGQLEEQMIRMEQERTGAKARAAALLCGASALVILLL